MKRIINFLRHPMALLAIALPILVLVPALAVAQVTPGSDIGSLIGLLVSSLQGGQTYLAIGAGLSILMYIVRTYVVPKWPWAQKDRGGTILNLAVSTLTIVAAQLLTGSVSLNVIAMAIAASWLSSGAYSQVKKIFWPSDAAPVVPTTPTT